MSPAVRVASPFPPAAWPTVWCWIQPFRGRVTDDFSPSTIEAFVKRHIEYSAGAATWGVYRGDELGGMVWIDSASDYLGVAHLIFKQAFWGRETTETALREIFGQAFASGMGKLCSNVFSDNYQLLALVKALGASEEGRLREHTLRYGGKPADMIAIGLLKRDFYANSTNRGGDNRRGVTGGRTFEPQEDDHGDADANLHAGTNEAAAGLEHTADGPAR